MENRELQKMVKGCLRGNSSSQKKLYDHFSGDMFKVCLMYAKDYDQANDLSCKVRIIIGPDSGESPSPLQNDRCIV